MRFSTIRATLCVLAAALVISCNKNSNELPPAPPVPPPAPLPAPVIQDTVTSVITLNNTDDVLYARLIRKTDSAGRDLVTLSLTSLTGQTIENLKLLVEISGSPANYDNTKLNKIVGPISVSPSKDTTVTVFTNEHVNIKDSVSQHIMLHPITYNTVNQPYAGAYAGIGSYAEFIRDSAGVILTRLPNYYLQAKGYVRVDGQGLVYIKSNGTESFNTLCKFGIANTFSGDLISSAGSPATPLVLDSITVGGSKVLVDAANGNLHMRMKLKKKLADSTQFIELYLNKN